MWSPVLVIESAQVGCPKAKVDVHVVDEIILNSLAEVYAAVVETNGLNDLLLKLLVLNSGDLLLREPVLSAFATVTVHGNLEPVLARNIGPPTIDDLVN